MIERKKIELTENQIREMASLTFLIDKAADVDKHGLLFAQVKPHDSFMTVFFLPHSAACTLVDFIETTKHVLSNPPPQDEKEE